MTFPVGLTLTNGATYYVVSRAVDSAGNAAYGATVAPPGGGGATFTYNVIAPFPFRLENVNPNAPPITVPVNNKAYRPGDLAVYDTNASHFKGTASDAGVNPSGIKGVSLRVSYLETGSTYYLIGTAFSSTT